MGMVVRTNVMAMNANRSLGINNNQVGKSLEKLSSGFRINRAADDASGLAISEKMKSQIKGLEQAAANSQDGISLIQTAEGATQEIHNMLNRMVELATKSASGTIQDDVDREAIQREVEDLNSEITRIAESTNFNGINLLNGDLAKTDTTAAMTFGTQKFDVSAGAAFTGTIQIIGGANATAGSVVADVSDEDAISITLDNQADKSFNAADIEKAVQDAAKARLSAGGLTADQENKMNALLNFKVDAKADLFVKSAATTDTGATAVAAGTAGGLNLQVGDTNSGFNHVTVSVDKLDASSLKLDTVDVSNQTNAGEAIQVINNAINKVSTNRANLGSLQNRLEYTINNLDTTAENMTAANSRIRDTDMAKEMMNYTKMNILTQAAQAMLAQANQQPQAILQLLQ